MAERIPNHKCKTCGIDYFACNDCDDRGNWRAVGCCIEHAQAYYKRVIDAREYAEKAANPTVSVDEEDTRDQIDDELSEN